MLVRKDADELIVPTLSQVADAVSTPDLRTFAPSIPIGWSEEANQSNVRIEIYNKYVRSTITAMPGFQARNTENLFDRDEQAAGYFFVVSVKDVALSQLLLSPWAMRLWKLRSYFRNAACMSSR
jgi:hypothetical protein